MTEWADIKRRVFSDETTFHSIEKTCDLLRELDEKFEKGCGKSGFLLGMLVGPGVVVGSNEVKKLLGDRGTHKVQYFSKAFPLVLRDAEDGDVESMQYLSLYYQNGDPPLDAPDLEKAKHWDAQAATGRRR